MLLGMTAATCPYGHSVVARGYGASRHLDVLRAVDREPVSVGDGAVVANGHTTYRESVAAAEMCRPRRCIAYPHAGKAV